MYVVNSLFIYLSTFFLLFLQIQASFEKNMLILHNKYRSMHGCPALKLDKTLSEECKKYAEELAAANQLQHSSGDYGENLCLTSGNPLTCVNMWYEENNYYSYSKGVFSTSTGHFTQLVWKTSKTLGVGKHKNKVGTTFVVARYKPAGNVKGHFKKNVPRPNRSCNKIVSSMYLILCCWIYLALILPTFRS